VTAKYEFIEAEKGDHAVIDMCARLHVSRSGYYDWRSRPMSATAERPQRLKTMIRAVFDTNYETYGYRRIHLVLTRSGERVSPELVRQLMRQMGLQPVQPRPRRPVTTLAGGPGGLPDLVERDFIAQRPGTRLVGDITDIPTCEGFLYLATVIDCRSLQDLSDQRRAGLGGRVHRHRARMRFSFRPRLELHPGWPGS